MHQPLQIILATASMGAGKSIGLIIAPLLLITVAVIALAIWSDRNKKRKARKIFEKRQRERGRSIKADFGDVAENLDDAPDDARPDLCPKCRVDMDHKHMGGFGLFVCPRCKGIFVVNNVLEKVLEAMHVGDGTFDAGECLRFLAEEGTSMRGTRECPGCHGLMDKRKYPGESAMTLDLCESCEAVWFDGGELTRLAKVATGEDDDRDTTLGIDRQARNLDEGISPYDYERRQEERSGLYAFACAYRMAKAQARARKEARKEKRR